MPVEVPRRTSCAAPLGQDGAMGSARPLDAPLAESPARHLSTALRAGLATSAGERGRGGANPARPPHKRAGLIQAPSPATGTSRPTGPWRAFLCTRRGVDRQGIAEATPAGGDPWRRWDRGRGGIPEHRSRPSRSVLARSRGSNRGSAARPLPRARRAQRAGRRHRASGSTRRAVPFRCSVERRAESHKTIRTAW